ncbi:hypothetical protein E5358_11965 [Palleniella muris]|uniref:Uncharacterized protein n=1 Tax=Palleniella muris TaxID=3038145 RepID=A0AC61QN07_9BACT|nr:hypothetical protein [Palleniella muris]TGX80727.1 hypothetical protein E5358_11965 [Palleniella muris]
MKKSYIKPEIEVIRIEESLLITISNPTTDPAAPDSEHKPDTPGVGGGDTPADSKDGFPWEDDFAFEID